MWRPVDVHAMTARSQRIELELVTAIQVGKPFLPEDRGMQPLPGVYRAVWDTGATVSTITEALANTLRLEQTGLCKAHGVDGATECRSFLISLFLPNGIVVPELEVLDCKGNIGCDVLVGMDVISLGDFAVSNYGKTTFTFRMPSVGEISFNSQLST